MSNPEPLYLLPHTHHPPPLSDLCPEATRAAAVTVNDR